MRRVYQSPEGNRSRASRPKHGIEVIVDAVRMAVAQKRADEQEAQRQKEAQTRAKQPNVMPQKAPKR